MSFAGKTAVVTGGGSGIGAALCRALVGAGADVLCTDIDGEAAAAVAAAARGPGSARAARLDVTDAAAVQAAVDGVAARAGRLDLMFNNAGIAWGGDTELLTLDQWNAIIDVNIRGVVHGVERPPARCGAPGGRTQPVAALLSGERSSEGHTWRARRASVATVSASTLSARAVHTWRPPVGPDSHTTASRPTSCRSPHSTSASRAAAGALPALLASRSKHSSLNRRSVPAR